VNDCDLILRGGTIVQNDNLIEADIVVADGKIVAIEKDFSGKTREEIDAADLHIFPGVIDSHVHFNEPGRADWEGFETGSRALAAGGGTLFFDMPLNAHPPTIDAESFDEKLFAAKKNSLTDFAFWGGLVPGNIDKLEELSDRGVIGFKAFMSDSGIDDFSRVEDSTLREGMKRAARLKKIVAVHAESETLTRQLSAERMARNQISVRDYLESRPVAAELDAIRRATDIAGETGCALHIVHVSSGAGIALILEAQKRGVNVTCETCPHYLALTEDDVEKLGAIAKCAPPLRSTEEQKQLWNFLKNGDVNTIGSDHSPSPPEMKTGENFFKVWGGISSVQHTLPLLITEAHFRRGIALMQIAKWISFNVAERFSLPKTKGRIEVGSDADFALVKMDEEFFVRKEELFYRHKQTPYLGKKLRGKIARTVLHGKTIFHNGKIASEVAGRLVKPTAA
jgi:allantoinase